MAVRTDNIFLGVGHLYYGTAGLALPSPTAGQSMRAALDAGAGWTYAGATTDGVEVSYEPEYTELEVDQIKSAVNWFNTGLMVSVGTNLAEVTLKNLQIAWGQAAASFDDGADGDTGQVLNIAEPSDYPNERVIALVGNGPLGVLNDARGRVGTALTASSKIERVYYGRRAISVEGSSHSLQKEDLTVFPVTFRLLPKPDSVGSEYGVITDRIYTPA